jgi:hypothetical protein
LHPVFLEKTKKKPVEIMAFPVTFRSLHSLRDQEEKENLVLSFFLPVYYYYYNGNVSGVILIKRSSLFFEGFLYKLKDEKDLSESITDAYVINHIQLHNLSRLTVHSFPLLL